MQEKLDFEFQEYVATINRLMIKSTGMSAQDLIEGIWKDCFDHGLPPSEAVSMFLADNARLLDADE